MVPTCRRDGCVHKRRMRCGRKDMVAPGYASGNTDNALIKYHTVEEWELRASLDLVAVVQLDVLLAYAPVEGEACVCGSQAGRAGLLEALVQEEDLV